jgi:hypothetical protein
VARRDPAADLARERRLIDGARQAIATGNESLALRRLAEHQRSFPAGFFREEREAMAIIALARTGRSTPARQRARRFAADFPASVFAARIAAALATPPRDH